MKITFVGSSHGVPEAGKQCACTLFEVGDRRYFIDAGCDINMALANRRINPDTVKGIFITHPHADHMDGLFAFLILGGWYYTDSNPFVYVPNEDCATLVHQYMKTFRVSLRPGQKLDTVKNGLFFDDGFVKVTAFPSGHCIDAHSFLIEAEGKRIYYSGDITTPDADFLPVDDLDAAILEGAHFPLTAYEEGLKSKNVRSVYINHYGNYLGRCNRENFVKLQSEVATIPCELTSDGMEITL